MVFNIMKIYVAPAPKEGVTIAKIFISRKTFILKLLYLSFQVF